MNDHTLKDLKDRIDMAALIAMDLGPADQTGRRLWWPCPFHEEKTPGAFGVTPNGRGYKCFGCGASGDHVTWLQEHRGLTDWPNIFAELKRLAGTPAAAMLSEVEHAASRVNHDEPPTPLWQERALAFIDYTEKQLWSEAGKCALAYLLDQRGLAEATIRRYRLGFNPRCLHDKPVKRWGLAEGKSVYLSGGIIIPCIVSSTCWYVQVRRPVQGDTLHKYLGGPLPQWRPDAKYMAVRGGTLALFGADDLRGGGRPLLFAEGEFDAMLAGQELGDLADVTTFGGAGKAASGIPGRWVWRLLPYETILAGYDGDAAGQAGASRLAAMSKRISPVTIPRGSDLTDFFLMGGDLRAWLRFHLGRLQQNMAAA